MLMYEIKISSNLGKIVLLHNILVVTKFTFYGYIHICVHEKSTCICSYMGDMYMYIYKHTYMCIYMYMCVCVYIYIYIYIFAF